MKIKPETKHIVIKYVETESNDVVSSHNEIIKKKGFVWFGKKGKCPDQDKVNLFLKEGKCCFLVAAGRNKNVYVCDVASVSFSLPSDYSLHTPTYYKNQTNEFKVWFKFTKIQRVKDLTILDKILCASSEKTIRHSLDFRTSFFYTYNPKVLTVEAV